MPIITRDRFGAFVDEPDLPVPNAPDGPLRGLTLAVKDNFDVAGYPTGCGNPTLRAESEADPPRRDAPVVAALLGAGAVFAGKTHTPELAYALDGRNQHYGTPINPAAPDRVPGGSSSGSAAAVAGGLVDIALGSDTGGSVRGPASFCGLVGLRTTHGRISLEGVVPLASSLDTAGWFARDLATYARVGEVLLGADADGPPLSRLLIAQDAIDLLPTDVEREATDAAIERVTPLLRDDGQVILAPGGLADRASVVRVIQTSEAWAAHGAWITSRGPDLGASILGRFHAGRDVTPDELAAAMVRRQEIRDQVRGLVRDDTVIALPTMPTIAPLREATDEELDAYRALAMPLLCSAGLAGLPQISVPLAAIDGAPFGLSLIGPAGRDRALIDLAARIVAAA